MRENSSNRAFSQVPHESAEEGRRETSKDWSRMLMMPERRGEVTEGNRHTADMSPQLDVASPQQ